MCRVCIFRASALFVALLVAMLVSVAPQALADVGSAWRIGAGWDNGISVRANLYRGWGIGVHYQYNGSSRIIGQLLGYPDQWNEYGLIVFGDSRLFERVHLGPFAEFILARDNIASFDTEAYGMIIGLRPSVHLLSDRFLLETRVGVQIVRREDLPYDDGHYLLTDLNFNEWLTEFYGQNVGLNSRLTFMILF